MVVVESDLGLDIIVRVIFPVSFEQVDLREQTEPRKGEKAKKAGGGGATAERLLRTSSFYPRTKRGVDLFSSFPPR